MPKFVTIGYGVQQGCDRTAAAIRRARPRASAQLRLKRLMDRS